MNWISLNMEYDLNILKTGCSSHNSAHKKAAGAPTLWDFHSAHTTGPQQSLQYDQCNSMVQHNCMWHSTLHCKNCIIAHYGAHLRPPNAIFQEGEILNYIKWESAMLCNKLKDYCTFWNIFLGLGRFGFIPECRWESDPNTFM